MSCGAAWQPLHRNRRCGRQFASRMQRCEPVLAGVLRAAAAAESADAAPRRMLKNILHAILRRRTGCVAMGGRI